MLIFLRDGGMLSERKARLFTCAAVRRVWHLLTDERSRRVLEVAERYAGGEADRGTLDSAVAAAWEVSRYSLGRPAAANDAAVEATWAADEYEGDYHPRLAAYSVRYAGGESEGVVQCDLLRDIFGPLPFRPLPPLEPSISAWNDGLIVKLATAIYEERSLPAGTLDSLRLGVLADALLDAGCTDAELLQHLRDPGPHWRGCWAVDLLLGKG